VPEPGVRESPVSLGGDLRERPGGAGRHTRAQRAHRIRRAAATVPAEPGLRRPRWWTSTHRAGPARKEGHRPDTRAGPRATTWAAAQAVGSTRTWEVPKPAPGAGRTRHPRT